MVKILVTDDADFFRTRMEKLLKLYGIEVVIAENGEEAIDKYNEVKPDMVFMDISMPVLDGIESTHRIIKDNPDAKICMLTAMGQQTMVKNALAAGAKDFIVKPFDQNKLIETIEKFTGQKIEKEG